MKKIYLLLVSCCLFFPGYAQIPVAYWSMETAAHTAGSAAITDYVSTDIGGSAIAETGIGGAIAYTNGAGVFHGGAANGEAIYANGNMSNAGVDPTTAATTYWQFNFATTGLSTMTMTFDEDEGTAAGVKYGVLYSTTGAAGSWVFVSSVTTLNGNTMGTAAGWATAKITLPAACNNAAAIYIRIYGYGRTAVSTFAVDNITILGATTVAGAVFTTANEADIYTMTRSGGAAGQNSRNNFVITGAATNVTINNTAATSGISVATANTLSITTGATITFGNTGIVNGAGTFSLASGCTLVTANTAGLTALGTATGCVQTTTARTLNGGANYKYDAAATQTTGTGLPATITTGGSVTVNNTAGVTLSQSTTINSGATLTLTSGKLTIGANNLILGATSTLAGAFSNAAMIITNSTGMVEKQMTTNGTFLYPIGDAVPNYTPITLDFTAGTYAGGAYAGVIVTNAEDANNLDTNNYINRYWNVKLSGITAPVYSLSATYVAADVIGSGANISTAEYTGALPWVEFGPINTVAQTLTATGLSVGGAITGISSSGPTVTSSANTGICSGTSTTLSVLSYTAATNYANLTFSWAPATGLSTTTGTSVIATPAVTTPYTVTVTDGNGFTAIATTTITVTSPPTAILGPSNVCITSSVTLSDLTPGGLWTSSFPGIASIDPSSGMVNGNDAGVTEITYTITSTGCYATAVFTVNALPTVAAIGGISNQCLGLTSTLTETTIGGIWSSADPGIASIMASGVVTGNIIGTTTMSYTFTDGFGCVNMVTTPDTVNSFPVVDVITGLSSVCVNGSITLSDDSLTGVWSSSNMTLATINAASGVMTGVSAGALTITYTVTNIYGCATPVTMDETINALPSVLPITGSNNECAGITMQLNDAIAGGIWSSTNTSIATINSTGVVTGVAFGSDNIFYTVTSTLGCVNTAVYVITIGNAMPTSVVLPADTSVTLCEWNPQNLVVNTTGAGLTYQWYMDNSPIIGATNGSYIATVPGQYIVQLNNGTCALALPYTDVIAPPDPIIGYNSTGPSLFTGDFYTYQWFRNDSAITAISSGASSAVLPVTLPGLYTVVVSDANGCFDTSAAFAYPIDTITTGISNVSNIADINVFPNPGNSIIHISAPVSVNVTIMSIDGKIVLEQKQATDINIAMLPGGMYIISICDENNMLLQNKKFTKIE